MLETCRRQEEFN